MGNPQENQQKKAQGLSGKPEAKGSDYQKQGVDQGKKTWPAGKEEDKADDPDGRPE
jgi:hypothetical protein